MRIIWNSKDNQFELQFDSNYFRDDLDAAKAAGFRTTGPPSWIWYTTRLKCLKYLQKHQPASGIKIAQDALAKFSQLVTEGKEKQALLKDAKKRQKAIRPQFKQSEPEQRYEVPFKPFEPPSPPDVRCTFCFQPVYDMLEQIEPVPVCMWCEKTITDGQGE
jgi:hypothetical protein